MWLLHDMTIQCKVTRMNTGWFHFDHFILDCRVIKLPHFYYINIVFSITYYLELHDPISFYYSCNFFIIKCKDVNVL